jgi:hypothetical protein
MTAKGRECAAFTDAKVVNKDCDGGQYEECFPCTRRKPKQLKDLVDLKDPETGKATKIFKCNRLTTKPHLKRTCKGEGFEECVFCTRMLQPIGQDRTG